MLSRTEDGLRQFHEYESKGIRPNAPDQYFKFLCDGKAWWEWTLNFIADEYLAPEWDGWYMKAIDFKDDPSGFRQLRQRCGCVPVDPQQVIDDAEAMIVFA